MERHNPFRPNINVLNKLIVSVKRGEKIALVGGTGSGKSTVIKVKYINKINFNIKFHIVKLAQSYTKESKTCLLCQAEKVFIVHSLF